MSVETRCKKTFQIIRLVSDKVMESEENEVKEIVEQTLAAGIKDFVFSVSIGSPADYDTVFRLLVWCRATIWRKDGELMLFERGNGRQSAFHTICESLCIPIYYNRDTVCN